LWTIPIQPVCILARLAARRPDSAAQQWTGANYSGCGRVSAGAGVFATHVLY
jgi:hypothetical protein